MAPYQASEMVGRLVVHIRPVLVNPEMAAGTRGCATGEV